MIALVIGFVIAVAGVVKPAYALSSDLGVLPANFHVGIKGNDNLIGINDSSDANNGGTDDLFWSFFEGVKTGIATTIGTVMGGAAVCYTIDGVATAIFPPAAALVAFCPAIGFTSGGATAVAGGVKAVIRVH